MYYYCNYKKSDETSIFELKKLPAKSFDKFIYFFIPEVNLTNETILLSLCILEKNIDRLIINDNSVYLISVFLLRITDKFHEDNHYLNDDWARQIKMDLYDFNYLEKKLLEKLNYNLYVSNNEFKVMETIFLSI
jgi:hypothetical protein